MGSRFPFPADTPFRDSADVANEQTDEGDAATREYIYCAGASLDWADASRVCSSFASLGGFVVADAGAGQPPPADRVKVITTSGAAVSHPGGNIVRLAAASPSQQVNNVQTMNNQQPDQQ